jgi:hypothetical protein
MGSRSREDQVGGGHCEPSCGGELYPFYQSLMERMLSSAEPVRENGIWPAFYDPQGETVGLVCTIFRVKYSCFFILMHRPYSNSLNVTTASGPYSPPCVTRLISQIRKTLSRSSSVFQGRRKYSRSCCSTSAIAVTSSRRMQPIRNSVRDLYPFQWPT